MIAETVKANRNVNKHIAAAHVVNELRVSFGGHSASGIKADNQDAFAALNTQGHERDHKGIVACIADGCSSAKFAKEAANLSVSHFINEYLATEPSWSVKKSVSKVLASLNLWLYSQTPTNSQQTHRQAHWMTTFSALILKSTSGFIFHLGDTRVAQFRDGELTQLTRDHKVNQHLTKALGAELHQEVDVYQFELKQHDIYVLSCDGVHDFLSKTQIIECINSEQDLEAAAKAITQLAIAQGSDDNVSCLLVKVQQLPKKCLDERYRDLTKRKIPSVLQVGQQLDQYKVLRQIYASTRSHIYLVQSDEYTAPVVLKTPSVNFAEDLHYLQGFMREGWVGQRIDHPNVMKVLSTADDSAFLYHICEYMDGQTLRQWQADNPKPQISQVRNIALQIVQALRAFQRLDMVHRDLKPDNVMIDAHGKVTLIDYGTVKIASIHDDIHQITDECPQGTLGYTAPETLQTLNADFKSDLFSLAVIVYELLSGHLPYKSLSSNQSTSSSSTFWHYRSIRDYRNDIPFWFDQTLMKATAVKPEHRYSSFSEFINDLNTPNSQLNMTVIDKPSFYQRNPVMVWQVIAIGLFLCLLTVLILPR
ncbi:bifunctional protein-serine/threonine kinase/phosphatase [Pseudoalteromonas haloplanktis]|uniref:Bifunctional protein-serine/threonine kinase/phosphatase n=1 Tax=Pseudoalteromonas haloplanktis TaxID=228 RepID=A0ABU1BGU9_PSEHA|nr:bifunctional protein-serine/threonine kinase/phosphatase [Pseudoalteromonas haloplanktis]MDQ9093713.1 bifunctional protein-serine/threonine kinase/phosphatase [Pseudoalteromonas haloplanktis]